MAYPPVQSPCPICTSTNVMLIRHSFGLILWFSCRKCEHTWWQDSVRPVKTAGIGANQPRGTPAIAVHPGKGRRASGNQQPSNSEERIGALATRREVHRRVDQTRRRSD
jgi:hypothetical protein